MASYLNKRARSSFEAVTGEGDLVSDVSSGREKLASLKDEYLPDNLKNLAPEKRQAELDKQMQNRKVLNDRLTALVQKRDAFLAEKRKAETPKKGSSFDRVVEETLKSQIKRQ